MDPVQAHQRPIRTEPAADLRRTALAGLRDEILYLMLKGETPIYMYQLSALDEIGVDPTNLSEEELEKVISKLRSILLTKND